jgi:hypothetical protein
MKKSVDPKVTLRIQVYHFLLPSPAGLVLSLGLADAPFVFLLPSEQHLRSIRQALHGLDHTAERVLIFWLSAATVAFSSELASIQFEDGPVNVHLCIHEVLPASFGSGFSHGHPSSELKFS